jgi:ABC-type amino acid transport substrate-binding protein
MQDGKVTYTKGTVSNRRYLLGWLVVAILVLGMATGAEAAPLSRPLRVGVYENPPKIYTTTNGKIDGFWPTLVRTIASREGWRLHWVHCTWDACLKKLQKGEIDILPDTGWTPERARKYAFSKETVLLSWTRVYVPKGKRIESILDLNGKTIAGLAGSFNLNGPGGLKDLIRQFGLHCRIVEMKSYQEVFQALEEGKVDAGITNKDFGNLNEKKYRVVRTPIVFQPAKMLFAFNKTSPLTPYLVKRIDADMKVLKADKGSVYYKALDRYLGAKEAAVAEIPTWVRRTLWGLAVGSLFLLLVWLATYVLVRRRTYLLRESEERLQTLINASPDIICFKDGEGRWLEANQADLEQKSAVESLLDKKELN